MMQNWLLNLLAQVSNLQISPQDLGRYMRVGLAAYNGNYEPAIGLMMQELANRQPSSATKVATVAKRITEHHEGQKRAFFRRFGSQGYGIYLVLGARGTGKTALALRLAEILKSPTYVVGIPKSVVPEGIMVTTIERLVDEAPNGSVVIIDDASLWVSPSEARSPEMYALQDLINICRHVDMTIILTGQQSASLYKYVTDADAIFLKPPSLLFKEFERPEVAKLFSLAQAAFNEIPLHEKTKRLRSVFVVAPEFVGMMEFDMPKGFTDKLSKNKARIIDAEFREITTQEE